jgi:hypothetical protein
MYGCVFSADKPVVNEYKCAAKISIRYVARARTVITDVITIVILKTQEVKSVGKKQADNKHTHSKCHITREIDVWHEQICM